MLDLGLMGFVIYGSWVMYCLLVVGFDVVVSVFCIWVENEVKMC